MSGQYQWNWEEWHWSGERAGSGTEGKIKGTHYNQMTDIIGMRPIVMRKNVLWFEHIVCGTNCLEC